MLFTPWLRSLKFPARLTRTARRRKRRFSPLFAVERLEDRTLLSVFAVNSVLDKVDLNPGNGSVDTGTPGEITLRAAIQEANALAGADTITLGAGTFTLSITGTGEDGAATGDLDITDTTGSLTILGAGAATTTIDAAGIDRVFDVFFHARLNLSGVTVTGGNAASGSTFAGIDGGGILNRGVHTGVWGTVTLTNSVVSGNSANRDGGGIKNNGVMTISKSTVSDNSARRIGGGIDSTAVFSGGLPGATLTLTDSVVSGNSANVHGGGLRNISTLTITNSTISGNSATEGGGILNDGRGVVSITNATVTGNSSSFGGGINNKGDLGGTVNVRSTIIAGNTTRVFDPDVRGTIASQGNNLIGDKGSATGFTDGVNGDQVGGGGNPVIDPLLGPLQDNGGPTFTHALLAGSPAIDTGNNTGAPATDQRGFPRIVDGDLDGIATIDIGAFEFLPPVIPIQIDIKPGSFPNSINLGSKGTIPVAIFSTPTFDATTIDPTTVTLADAPVRLRGKGRPMASAEDVNGDGLLDLVVHVKTKDLELTDADSQAQLTGETFDGVSIVGTDTIRVVAALHVAGGPAEGVIVTDGLTHATLNPVIQQSLAYWTATGVEPRRLEALTQVDVQIADLSDSLLGIAALNIVWIDRDAAGYGWSVNSGGVDLFSAVTHEFGHVLGLGHTQADDVMQLSLAPGIRQNQISGYLEDQAEWSRTPARALLGLGDVFLPLSTPGVHRPLLGPLEAPLSRSKSQLTSSDGALRQRLRLFYDDQQYRRAAAVSRRENLRSDLVDAALADFDDRPNTDADVDGRAFDLDKLLDDLLDEKKSDQDR